MNESGPPDSSSEASPVRPGWAGAVLCGGASRRMGRDKALLGPPDRPLAARVRAAIIGCGIGDVVLVGGDAERLRPHGPWVPDDDAGAGPLSALATVQRLRPTSALLVCACDLPALTADACGDLLRAVEAGAVVAVPEVDGRAAWSCVAVSAAGARLAAEAVAHGERSMHGALGAMEGLVRLASNGDAFVDADDPVALAQFDVDGEPHVSGRCHPCRRSDGSPR